MSSQNLRGCKQRIQQLSISSYLCLITFLPIILYKLHKKFIKGLTNTAEYVIINYYILSMINFILGVFL